MFYLFQTKKKFAQYLRRKLQDVVRSFLNSSATYKIQMVHLNSNHSAALF